MHSTVFASILVSALLACVAPSAGARPRADAEPPASPASTTTAVRHSLVARDGHELALWSKAPPAAKGAILLLHGRTWSALPNFDLQVPGRPRSVMDALAHAGYAAYALDQRGYGASPRDASGWLTPERAATDAIDTAIFIRAEHPDLPAPTVIGYSQGALTALLAAQHDADAFSALVLYGFPADIDAPAKDVDEPEQPPRHATTAAAAASDFVVQGAAPQEVIDAYVQQALAADPVRVDWRDLEQFRFDPSRVSRPTLLLHGVSDGYVKPDALARLFNRLASTDRRWIVLPDSDHTAHLGTAQAAWIEAITDFIERERPVLGKH